MEILVMIPVAIIFSKNFANFTSSFTMMKQISKILCDDIPKFIVSLFIHEGGMKEFLSYGHDKDMRA